MFTTKRSYCSNLRTIWMLDISKIPSIGMGLFSCVLNLSENYDSVTGSAVAAQYRVA
jgi:hypothetical protein